MVTAKQYKIVRKVPVIYILSKCLTLSDPY